jgi:hypothetical protein
MRKKQAKWRGIVLTAVVLVSLVVPSGTSSAAPRSVALYEGANLTVNGKEGVDYIRKSGNNPRFTSNGSLLVMLGLDGGSQVASVTATTLADADTLVIPVRGQPCSGSDWADGSWPHFTVRVDGVTVLDAYATRKTWQQATGNVDIPAGRHTFTIVYDNEHSTATCDRNLRIDHIAIYQSALSDPPTASFPQTTWAPIGADPLTDSEAAGLITHRPETRPGNAAANNYVPSDAELDAVFAAEDSNGQTPDEVNPLTEYVSGRPGLSNPSTDDLIQWTAHKWGIPEDIVRAQMANESSWRQTDLGDQRTVPSSWYGLYPPQARVASTSDVYQSMGLSQIKWKPDGSQGAGTEPLRWKSTAFNLDYYGAWIRYYYDGLCDWCGLGYTAGQNWNSVGAWYQPDPWMNFGQLNYILHVQSRLENRDWETY